MTESDRAASGPATVEVDFYVLGGGSDRDPWTIACRLAEKAWRRGHRVHVQVESGEDAARLDDLLWTWRQDSFVPHARLDPAAADPPPVTIGAPPQIPPSPDVVINLGERIPSFAERCRRLAEIVGPDPGSKASGRERYREYRDRGFEVRSHDL